MRLHAGLVGVINYETLTAQVVVDRQVVTMTKHWNFSVSEMETSVLISEHKIYCFNTYIVFHVVSMDTLKSLKRP